MDNSNKDYTKLTLEELLLEEKKIRKNEFLSALAIGFLVGVIFFGFVKKGFGFLYISISLGLIYLIYRNSKTNKQNLLNIQSEIKNKNSK